MRCLLLAFSLGVIALQQRAHLPPSWYTAYVLALGVGAIGFAAYSARATGRRKKMAHAAALLVAALSVGMGGFLYAGWRAEVRLADELPPAWEGQDIELVGI